MADSHVPQFVYPVNLPIMTMLESFHRNKIDMRPQLKVFYWAFGLIFIWETLPQYIMPLLTAVSVFCLAKRDSCMCSGKLTASCHPS